MSDDTQAVLTVSFKGGEGYDAPLLVIRADDPQTLLQRIDGVAQAGILAKATEVGVEFGGLMAAAKGLGARPVAVQGDAAPAQAGWGAPAQAGPTAPAPSAPAPQAPAAPGPVCQHGARVFRSGTGKNGKPWSAWFCPTPKGTQGQCEPEWNH